MFRAAPVAALLSLLPLACGAPAPESRSPDRVPVPAQTAPTGVGEPPLVVFLGDSLTAGLGLGLEQTFPSLVADELAARGVPIRAVNAGVSGDTTAGGLARLDWVLQQRPDLLVVGLGANDGLRGLPLDEAEANLRRIVERARAGGAGVLLLGMQIPRSYGPDYADGFAAIYPRLARELDVPLVPFLLEGVAGVTELNLEDGIHPNAEGHRRVAETVRPHLEEAARQTRTPRDASGS